MKRITTLALCALALVPQAFSQKLITSIDVGGQPSTPAANISTNMIYVPNTTLGTITVISGATETVVANVPVGSELASVAVNPSTNLIYASNGSSVAVIDGSSNTVIDTVPFSLAVNLAVNPTTNLIYVESGSGTSALSILDGASNEIIGTINLGLPCCIVGMAVDSNLNRVYCTIEELGGAPQLVAIDGNTNKFTVIPLTGVLGPGTPVVDSSLSRVYVPDTARGGLYVFDDRTGSLITTVLAGYTGPVAVNLANHQIADFYFVAEFADLFFVDAKTFGTVGGDVSFPSQQSPVSIVAGANNRFYITFYKNRKNIDFVAVVSGPQAAGAPSKSHQSAPRPVN
jgi:DNA-binding beta-propeller fold protein YncE